MNLLKLSKLLAYGAVGFYIWQIIKENDGSLNGVKGNPEGWRVQVDKEKLVDSVMPWVDVNPKYRDAMGHAFKTFLGKRR